MSAVVDNGTSSGVWLFDQQKMAVDFRPVTLAGVGEETALISNGVEVGDQVVALGARLLHDGDSVRVERRRNGITMTNFNLSALAVRERAITLFLIIAITLAGAYAFAKLGRAEDPPFTIKIMTVTAMWPGATAKEMQDLVAEPLEKRMQELALVRPGRDVYAARA